jgi:hypothetical protein
MQHAYANEALLFRWLRLIGETFMTQQTRSLKQQTRSLRILQTPVHDTDGVLSRCSVADPVRPVSPCVCFDPVSGGDRGTNRRPVRVVRKGEVQCNPGLYRMQILHRRQVLGDHRKQSAYGLYFVSSWKILGISWGHQRIDVPVVS